MADKEGIADIISGIQTDVKTIVHDEIELAKAELVPQAKAAGLGVGLFGAAGYLALTSSILLFFTLALLIAMAFGTFLATLPALVCGFAVMTIVLLIIAGVFVLTGKGKFSFTKPEKTIDSAQRSVASVRQALSDQTKAIADTPLIDKKDAPAIAD